MARRPPAASTGRPGAPEGTGSEPDPAQVATWIEAARNGDEGAFGALVEAYGAVLFRVIGRLVGDPDDRDDLVQETFVRAYEALARFRAGADFRPWLLTIGLNAVRDHLRRRQRPRVPVALEGVEGEPLPLPAPDPLPDARAEGEDLRARAEAAFSRLSHEARAILWLRVREGLQYQEIAEVLGIPRGTVMSRLARARAELRLELERSQEKRKGEEWA